MYAEFGRKNRNTNVNYHNSGALHVLLDGGTELPVKCKYYISTETL